MGFDEAGVRIAALRRDPTMCGVQPPDPSKKQGKAAGYNKPRRKGVPGMGCVRRGPAKESAFPEREGVFPCYTQARPDTC